MFIRLNKGQMLKMMLTEYLSWQSFAFICFFYVKTPLNGSINRTDPFCHMLPRCSRAVYSLWFRVISVDLFLCD